MARRPLRARGAGDGPRHRPAQPRAGRAARPPDAARHRAARARARLASASSRASGRSSPAATAPTASCGSTTRTATSSRSSARSPTRPRSSRPTRRVCVAVRSRCLAAPSRRRSPPGRSARYRPPFRRPQQPTVPGRSRGLSSRRTRHRRADGCAQRSGFARSRLVRRPLPTPGASDPGAEALAGAATRRRGSWSTAPTRRHIVVGARGDATSSTSAIRLAAADRARRARVRLRAGRLGAEADGTFLRRDRALDLRALVGRPERLPQRVDLRTQARWRSARSRRERRTLRDRQGPTIVTGLRLHREPDYLYALDRANRKRPRPRPRCRARPSDRPARAAC